MKNNYIIHDSFFNTGECIINVPAVIKDYEDKKWVITKWVEYETKKPTFRLIKKDLRSKENVLLKVTISEEQANQIISKLGLIEVPDFTFRSASTFRMPEYALN